MKKFILPILVMITGQHAFSQNKDVEELKRLNQAWGDLSIKKDTAAFAKIFADDFVLINPAGGKITKWEGVKNILHQDIKSINIDSIDVHLITNEVGLVTCYTTFVLINDGKNMTGKNSYQDVYIKRNGRWLALSAHVTLYSIK